MYYHLQHNPKMNSQDSPAFFRRSKIRTGAGLVSITAPCGNVESFSAFFIAIIGALVYQGWWLQGWPSCSWLVPGWDMKFDDISMRNRWISQVLSVDVIGWFVWLVLKLLSSSDPHPDPLFWHSFWHTIWKSFFLAYVPTFFLAFYLAYLLTFFLEFYLVYLRSFFVVEVRRGTLWSGACGGSPAGNTLIRCLW